MSPAPRSDRFDDVYFSDQDGLAETRHVFHGGNKLPDAWNDKPLFHIAETGFGTGLNFLATALLFFSDTAAKKKNEHRLIYTGYERYPLSAQDIRNALAPWSHELQPVLDDFLSQYEIGTNEVTLNFGQLNCSLSVTCHLIWGDVNDTLPLAQRPVDCWFLDGFKPSTNPEMWTPLVFENMARLSISGTSLSSFTAAGFVRRGLSDQGFVIEKTKGFGRKRDMIVGYKP
jgi:tRNA 5-methylaminomethyl-2-thiouridine biosynthesis bifunctional protein